MPDGPDSAMAHRSVASIKAYPVEERAGIVWAWMGAGDPMVPVEDDIPEELLREDAVIMRLMKGTLGFFTKTLFKADGVSLQLGPM